MTTQPAAGYFTASGRKNSEAKQSFDDMLAVMREIIGGEATSEMTIAAGTITPTVATHTVDTEADAAADNLDNILQTNLPDGRHLILFPEDVARVVTLRHNQGGAGEILLVGGANFALGTADSWIWFRGLGTTWKEVLRSSSAALQNKFNAAIAPGLSDDAAAGYAVGSQWVDTVADKAYVCLDPTNGAAVWKETTAAVGGLQNKLNATVAPGLTDDSNAGYSDGSFWIDVTGDQSYRCVDATVGAAKWLKTTLSTSDLGTLALLNTVATAQIDNAAVTPDKLSKPDHAIPVAVGDETTAITTGLAKVTFRMPFAMTLSKVKASLTTASASGIPTVDINESGVTILSTKLTIDASEKTSETAATAAVISDTDLAADAEITIDIDVAGSGAKGLKVYLIGKPA